jgi:cytochrome c2
MKTQSKSFKNYVLTEYLTKFQILGNAMAFAGIPNAKDRADVVAYLKEAK